MLYYSNSRGAAVLTHRPDHPHTVRLEIDGINVIQTSASGVTRMRISNAIVSWMIEQTGSCNTQDWYWTAEYDWQHNHNFARFHFASAQVAMMFKLAWSGA